MCRHDAARITAALAPELRYLLCVVLSYVSGILPASVLAGVPVHSPRPDLVATSNGLVMQGANVGNLLGPPAAAAAVAWAGGWHGVPWLIGVVALAGIVASLALGTLERRRVPA